MLKVKASTSDRPWVCPLLSRFASPFVVVTWVGVLAYGSYLLATYEMGAGSTGETPLSASSNEHSLGTNAHLRVFLHPHCPCSSATAAELERLLVECGEGMPSVIAYFLDPSGEPDNWTQSDLWDKVEKIPGVEVVADIDGEAAQLYGAETSGQVLLYGEDGGLLFRGGITGGRGHEGGNRGRSAILAHLNGIKDAPATSPVFGCRIQ